MQRLKQDWEELAEVDLYWAILSDPERRAGGWQLEDFFASGRAEVEEVLRDVRRLAPASGSGRALDVGCGAGRLTRALAGHFDRAVGIDISEAMVAEAHRINAGVPGCEFVVGSGSSLRPFADDEFDLVYCSIVLQHLPSSRTILEYVGEFLRVAAPGGIVAFQAITAIPLRHRVQPRRRLYRLLRRLGVPARRLYGLDLQPIAITAVREEDVLRQVAQAGGTVLERRTTPVAGDCRSTVFFVSPPAG